MLAALFGGGVELDAFKRLIIKRTEANPFFIEEMVQALFDEGALVRNGAVKVARSVATASAADGAGHPGLAYRPAAGGGEGVAADPGGTGMRISARAGAACDAQAGRRVGAHGRTAAGRGVHLRAAGGGRC
jgi:hypothetical protein